MGASPLRYKRLISNLPKHKNATDAILASGFSKNTAKSQQKRVLHSALRHQAKEILNASPDALRNSKQLMSDIVGMSGQELFNRLKYIATQDKDLGSALKVLAPLVREHGVILASDDDQAKVIVPVINLGFTPQNMAKNIEPPKDPIKVESQEIKEGSVEP